MSYTDISVGYRLNIVSYIPVHTHLSCSSQNIDKLLHWCVSFFIAPRRCGNLTLFLISSSISIFFCTRYMYIKLWFRYFIYCKFCGQVMACASAIWWKCMQNGISCCKTDFLLQKRLAALQFSTGIIIELIRKRKFVGYTVCLITATRRKIQYKKAQPLETFH